MNTKQLLKIEENLTKAIDEIKFMEGERTEIAYKHIRIAKRIIRKNLKQNAITESNQMFKVGEQVLLITRNLVTIDAFCEDGMILIEDNNDYYKVENENLRKHGI